METYLDTSDLWSNLEESLGKLNYSIFLNPDIIDMWLDNFDAYNPDEQAAENLLLWKQQLHQLLKFREN